MRPHAAHERIFNAGTEANGPRHTHAYRRAVMAKDFIHDVLPLIDRQRFRILYMHNFMRDTNDWMALLPTQRIQIRSLPTNLSPTPGSVTMYVGAIASSPNLLRNFPTRIRR
ncbi:hypothetical protein RLIN73S_03916 [Rhodanobacter lindaniclasticus]